MLESVLYSKIPQNHLLSSLYTNFSTGLIVRLQDGNYSSCWMIDRFGIQFFFSGLGTVSLLSRSEILIIMEVLYIIWIVR